MERGDTSRGVRSIKCSSRSKTSEPGGDLGPVRNIHFMKLCSAREHRATKNKNKTLEKGTSGTKTRVSRPPEAPPSFNRALNHEAGLNLQSNTSKSDPLSQFCSGAVGPPRGAPRPPVQDQTAALGRKDGAPLVFRGLSTWSASGVFAEEENPVNSAYCPHEIFTRTPPAGSRGVTFI